MRTLARAAPVRRPIFERLAEAIVYQQLNGKAAVTIFNVCRSGGAPDDAQGILKLTEVQIVRGLFQAKSSVTIRSLAELDQSGELDFTRLPDRPTTT